MPDRILDKNSQQVVRHLIWILATGNKRLRVALYTLQLWTTCYWDHLSARWAVCRRNSLTCWRMSFLTKTSRIQTRRLETELHSYSLLLQSDREEKAGTNRSRRSFPRAHPLEFLVQIINWIRRTAEITSVLNWSNLKGTTRESFEVRGVKELDLKTPLLFCLS